MIGAKIVEVESGGVGGEEEALWGEGVEEGRRVYLTTKDIC